MSHQKRTEHSYHVSSMRAYRKSKHIFSQLASINDPTLPRRHSLTPYGPMVWPAKQIPRELFDEILGYLCQQDARSLRLVNKEFEEKASPAFFRDVLVPFRADLFDNVAYDISATHPTTEIAFSVGMRVFQSFGHHIRRFGLSLEFPESTLAHPPLKTSQQAMLAFWGIYRWPHDTYQTYSDLDKIETTADDIERMREAFLQLPRVQELSLSCNALLGYLLGPANLLIHPSTSHDVVGRKQSGHRQYRRQPLDMSSEEARCITNAGSSAFIRATLEIMVKRAGFQGCQVVEAVNLLLETEGVTMEDIELNCERLRNEEEQALANSQGNTTASAPGSQGTNRSADGLLSHLLKRLPLVPKLLTQAQTELLSELIWAHQALIQSYIIAIIDHSRNSHFQHVTTLSVTKLPGSYLHMFERDDVWESLPNLSNVSFAIIADWRRINRHQIDGMRDEYVSPLATVQVVFKLLKDYIAPRRNITSLHFEWICGGEFAPTYTQRNYFVLPAPFGLPEDIVNLHVAKHPEKHIHFPHLKSLSLKNCYCSPHLFTQVVRQSTLCSLEILELESMSFTGPPIHLDQNTNGTDMMIQWHLLNGNQNNSSSQPLWSWNSVQAASNPQLYDSQAQLQQPRLFSWAGFIDHFAKGTWTRPCREWDVGSATAAEPRLDCLPFRGLMRRERIVGAYQLKRLSFKSCGYVDIFAPCIDTFSVAYKADLPRGGKMKSTGTAIRSAVVHMQCCEDDLAGTIISSIPEHEDLILRAAFGMVNGWANVYDKDVCEAARQDGYPRPGAGRFSGNLDTQNIREEDVEMNWS